MKVLLELSELVSRQSQFSQIRSTFHINETTSTRLNHESPRLGRDEADVEDLFDAKMYVDLVNAAYAGALAGSPITVEDLGGGDRITKDVSALFADRGVNGGKFNHFAPAGALLRARATKLPKAVLDRAEKLMSAINMVLDS